MTHSREDTYLIAFRQAQAALQKLDPFQVAYRAACEIVQERDVASIAVRYFGEDYRVSHPRMVVLDSAGHEPDITTRLIILHYLIHADGTPPADHWFAYRELPDGRIYDLAFQKRSSSRLAQVYGADARGFAAAAELLGGEKLTFGDASYSFRVLPRLLMAVILHLGDEEFGPAVNVVFDAAAGHYLPAEDLAILGGILASRLIKAGNA
jgi:hypothetical protein